MRQLDYDTSIKTRRPNFATKTRIMTKRKSKKEVKTVPYLQEDAFETLQLEKRIAALEKQLKDVDMKAIAYSTMVDIAEKRV